MKKKLISLLLILCLSITSLVGCSLSNDEKEKESKKTIKFTENSTICAKLPDGAIFSIFDGTSTSRPTESVAPDKLVGLSGEWSEDSKDYIDKKYTELPIFGQFYGKGDLNMEALAAAEPQLIIDIGEKKDGMKEDLDSIQEQTGIPTIFVEATTANMSDCYTTLGKILNVEDDAKILADYCKITYDSTFNILPNEIGRAHV